MAEKSAMASERRNGTRKSGGRVRVRQSERHLVLFDAPSPQQIVIIIRVCRTDAQA